MFKSNPFRRDYILLYFAIITFSFILNVEGSTLDDIRDSTRWQSPKSAERGPSYIPLVSPAELISFLDKYHGDIIQMNVLFNGLTTKGLNTCIMEHGKKHRWPSKKYIEFTIKDGKEKQLCKNINIFIAKDHPNADKLVNLQKNARISIIGKVKNTAKGKAWIDVLELKV